MSHGPHGGEWEQEGDGGAKKASNGGARQEGGQEPKRDFMMGG